LEDDSPAARSNDDEAFEIVLRGGRRLRVGGGFDEELLKRLVQVLEGC
jgi:hypothetical protein